MSEDDDAVRVREWDVDEYRINYNAVVAKCRRIQATVDRLLTEREAVEAERARQESAFYRELRRREKAEAENDRLVGTLAVMAEDANAECDVLRESVHDAASTLRTMQDELDWERNRVRAAERILNRVADGGTAVLAARGFLRASTILAEWPEDGDCQHLWHETRTAKRADRCPACNEENA